MVISFDNVSSAILNLGAYAETPAGPPETVSFEKEMYFEQVFFVYGSDKQSTVLNNRSFALSYGECVAMAEYSRSGKQPFSIF